MTSADQQLTRFRLKVIIGLTPLFFVLILIRLFYWQIIRGPQLSARANKQHSSTQLLMARRGNIFDSNGNLLAGINNLYHLYLYKPQLENNPQEIIEKLALIITPEPAQASPGAEPISQEQLLKESKDFLFNRLSLSSNWISIKHYLSQEQKEAIDRLNLPGLGFDPEFLRYYPESSLSAQVLGFVGKNLAGQEQGYFGLEGYFDRQLKGRSGKVRGEQDAYGNPILIGNYRLLQSQDGGSLTITIDKAKQYISEKLLLEGIKTYGAKAGTVTVMEVSSGKIKVLASFPNYDPTNYPDFDKSSYKNPVVSDLFEPGSVLKPIIMAEALEKGVVNLDTVCDICTGPITIGQFSIKTWDDNYHPNSNMTEILVNSDNIGMVFISRKLGRENFLKALGKFGFDSLTNIEQQEEEAGNFKKGNDFKDIDLATNAFGQGIAITRIELLTAFNALANQGYLVKPTLIEKIDDQIVERPRPIKVLSEKTSREIGRMLVEVVNNGESKWTKPKNIVVAGKTGTAQIPVNGKYDPGKTITSFIGFFPANKPKYSMLVTLTQPQTSIWGSETAAPLWFKIANQLLL